MESTRIEMVRTENTIQILEMSELKKQYYINNPNKKPIGKKHPMYNHDVMTQSIVDTIKQKMEKRNSKFMIKEWKRVAKETGLIGNFTSRIPEINEILGMNFKTMGDVFQWADNLTRK